MSIRFIKQFRKGRAARRIVEFGWPLVMASLSQTLIANIDAAMVGRISLDALAALGVASTVMHFFIIVGVGISFGLNASVSAELGTHSHARSGRAILSGLQISLFSGPIVACLAYLLAPSIYSLMGLEGSVLELAMEYTKIFCLFLAFSAVYCILSAAFSAHLHTRVVMIASIVMCVLNVFGNYVLIFGHWGFPRLGIKGAAIASVASIAIGTLILAVIMWLRRRQYHLDRACTETGFRYFAGRIGKLGMTTVTEWMLWFGGILLLNAMVLRCGTAEVALFNVGIKIQSLFMLCMAGTGGACSAMVSRAVGAKHPKRIRMWTTTTLWVGEMTLLPGILLLALIPEWVLRVYMRAEDIMLLDHVRLTGILLAVLITIRVNNTTVGTTLRCMGVLRYFLLCLVFSELIMLPSAFTAIVVFKLGAAAAFGANILEESIRACLYWLKFRKC